MTFPQLHSLVGGVDYGIVRGVDYATFPQLHSLLL